LILSEKEVGFQVTRFVIFRANQNLYYRKFSQLKVVAGLRIPFDDKMSKGAFGLSRLVAI